MELENGFIVEERYSTWQSKKVRTIIVNAHAKTAQQRSIMAALDIARPFDRIELTGGDYHEAVTLSFPVELVASEGEEPVIISRNSGITITTDIEVYLESLHVISRSSSVRLDAALVVMGGTSTAKSCNFSCVIIGGTARPLLENCTIENSAGGCGVVVQDVAGGVLRQCTVRRHKMSCLQIDTRGQLLVTECMLANTGADVVVLSAANSTVPLTSLGDHSSQRLRCTGVTITSCRLYVDALGGVSSSLSDDQLTANAAGSPCCLVISNGAAPTCDKNELAEGEIGILLDSAGPAQLRSNIISNQRRCGILALVEEGFGFLEGHHSLRITGDNVIERCFIGVDVQCRNNQRDVFGVTREGASPTSTLPNAKRAFHWLPLKSEAADSSDKANEGRPMMYAGEMTTPRDIKKGLARLVSLALRAHPTCLKSSFADGIAVTTTTTGASSSRSSARSTIAEHLHSMLGVKGIGGGNGGLSPKKVSANEEAYAEMLELRGNRGVDLVKTKFSSCELCAVRFGKQSYGLVEDCVFEGCASHAIIVESAAHPIITGCRVLRSRGASIVLRNFAHPLIVGNEISSGLVSGLEIGAMSRGIIVGNLITSCHGCGIRAAQSSVSLICGNMISSNRSGGVMVTEGASPTIMYNALVGNAVANVLCTDSSEAFVGFNYISSSNDAGVHFTECSRGMIVGNDITTNGDGVVVELDADPIVWGNSIRDNVSSGVVAQNNALGSFTKNIIERNMTANVLVREGASPFFRDNTITASGNGGVVVIDEGAGWFEKNQIGENGIGNIIVVDAHSQPTFTHNNVFGSSSGCGIVCAKRAGGVFRHNTIHDNKQAGIYVVGQADPLFDDNRVYREAVGIIMSDKGKGRFTNMTVELCFGSGVITQREAEPAFDKNMVRKNSMNGLLVASDGYGKFTNNSFVENDIGVQLGSSLQAASLQLNSVFLSGNNRGFGADGNAADDNGRASKRPSSVSLQSVGGILSESSELPSASSPNVQQRQNDNASPMRPGRRNILHETAAAIEKRRTSTLRLTACQVMLNTIENNTSGGVLLESSCNGIVEDNVVSRNGDYGVRANVRYSSQRTQRIIETRFAGSGTSAISASGPGSLGQTTGGVLTEARISKNRIHNHMVANVVFEAFTESSGMVSLVENDVANAPIGVFVTGSSLLPLAEKNKIYGCLDGVYFDRGGKGDFTHNLISDCHYCGVYVCDNAEPTFLHDNVIEHCRVAGIMVDAHGRGSYMKSTVRKCGLAGVLVFAGPTTPFHVTYDEVVQAGIVSATPLFQENVIEENGTHGVLVLSVINGSSLRTSRVDSVKYDEEGRIHFPTVPPLPKGARQSTGGHARGERLCACFQKNTIHKNRLFGVFHDRFDHWDLDTIFEGSVSALPSSRDIGKGNTSPNPPPIKMQRPPTGQGRRSSISASPDMGIKNAYGGYEILLGTSQIGDNPENHRQRELKQVTFKHNTISGCSVGVAAGYGCHPFLLRNKIINNVYFGLLMRFGSAIMARECEISGNGLAGVFAASGAKGFLCSGKITANNALCRPRGRPNDPRNISEVMGELSSLDRGLADHVDVVSMDLLTPTETSRTLRACEQITQLANVHDYALTKGVQLLWELACASSCAMSLASGCSPTSLATAAAEQLGSTTNSRTLTSLSPEENSFIGGIGIRDYVRVCVADGGLGVWIEEGSRVTLSQNTIVDNAHAGVYFGAGVAKQHSVLHKFFSMSGDGTGAFGTGVSSPASAAAGGRIGQVVSTKNGVVIDRLATLGRRSSAMEEERGMFSLPLERPPLATHHAAALFTTHTICANTVMAVAAVQLTNSSANFPSPHMNNSFTSYSNMGSCTFDASTTTLGGIVPPAALMDSGNAPDTEDGGGGRRADSIHCALVTENKINNNGEFGLFLEISQVLRAMEVPNVPRPASRRTSLAAPPTRPATAVDALFVSPQDIAVMSGEGVQASRLDFHIIVEGNTIAKNGKCGLVNQHVVDVRAGKHVQSRGWLNDVVQTHYETIRSDLMLRRGSISLALGNPAWRQNAPPASFLLAAERQRVHHAYVLDNDFSGNVQSQGEVTARYVVTGNDGTRTLLQFDTLGELSTSRFSSQVLACIPAYAALLSHPPPGISLWERNTFHDSKAGVRITGLLGSSAARFQKNRFEKIVDDAVLVEGHLTVCTIGAGNRFLGCGTGVRLRTDATFSGGRTSEFDAMSSTVGMRTSRHNDMRTRIWGNTFGSCSQASVVVERCIAEHVLLYGNMFTKHNFQTVGVFLTDAAERGVLVEANVFQHSFTPVVVAGSTSALLGAKPQAKPTGAGAVATRHTFRDNRFSDNFIGLLVCNGASPVITRCLFERNSRAGLEVMGFGSRPNVRECVFRAHCRAVRTSAAPDAENAVSGRQAGTDVPPSPSASSAAMKYPENGKIPLLAGSFTVEIVRGNCRVLSPNSQVCLPAGLIIAPFAEGTVEMCLFVTNDVGVDAAREALPLTGGSSTDMARVHRCVFVDSRVTGVLVRHPDVSNLKTSPLRAPRPISSVPSVDATQSSGQIAADTTLFSECSFAANQTSEDLFGDVLAMRDGYAAFRKNTFYGTVHCVSGSGSLFAGNTFISETQSHESEEMDDVFSGFTNIRRRLSLSPEARCATRDAALPAFILHSGASASAIDNLIAFRRKGVLVSPESSGLVRGNTLVGCGTAVVVAPYSHSTVAANRILRSLDCGIQIFGGLTLENEIFDAPTAMVIQPPNQYSSYNAIPSNKRNNADVAICSRNRMTFCSGDGILVAATAKLDGNVVNKCTTGVNIVCPASMEMAAAASGIAGLTASSPQITGNTVYDCNIGVVMDDNSVSDVLSNDIFDNANTGVLILGTAAGTLHNNSISCANERGAVEVPPDCHVKTLGNIIRNQFSPAYNRTTRAFRAKDHISKKEAFEKEIGELEDAANDALKDGTAKLGALIALPDTIADTLSAVGNAVTKDDNGADMVAGLPSRSLIRRSLENAITASNLDENVVVEGAGESDTSARYPRTPSAGGSKSRSEEDGDATDGSAPKPKRRASGGSRRGSATAKKARQRATEAGRGRSGGDRRRKSKGAEVPPSAAASRTGGRLSLGGPKTVLIHVFARPSVPNAHTSALALGEAVGRVFASPPMSQMQVATTVTTSASHLASTLNTKSGQEVNPFVTIVVVDMETVPVTGAADRALKLLLGAARPGNPDLSSSTRGSAAKRESQNWLYVIHPDSSANPGDVAALYGSGSFAMSTSGGPPPSSSGDGGASTRGITLQEVIDQADATFSFQAGVEEALDPLKDALTEQIRSGSRSAGGSSRRQSGAAALSPPGGNSPLERSTSGGGEFSDPSSATIRSDVNSEFPGGARRSSGAGLTLSRERIGEILSKLTPEALGFPSPKGEARGAVRKARRTSVAGSTASSPSAQRRLSRAPTPASGKDDSSPKSQKSSASPHAKSKNGRTSISAGTAGLPPRSQPTRKASVGKKGSKK